MTDRPQWTMLLGLLHAGFQYGGDLYPTYIDYGVEEASSDWWSHLWDARTGLFGRTLIQRWGGTVVGIFVNP